MVGIAGLKDVEVIDGESPLGLANFESLMQAMKFIRSPKKMATWMSDETVFEMHELLDLMLRTCVREGRVLMLGNDFDACIGFAEGYDQVDFIIVKVKVKSPSHWCVWHG